MKIDETHDDALFTAIMKNDIAKAERAISDGANVNGQDKSDRSPLYLAASYDRKEICDLLIENKADINAVCGDDQKTPLHIAAIRNRPDIARILIKAGAEIDPRDDDGYTPLMEAALYGHREICDLLIENKADVNARASMGTTMLMAAANGNNSDCFRNLVTAGSDITAVSDGGLGLENYMIFIQNPEIRQIVDEKLTAAAKNHTLDYWRSQRVFENKQKYAPRGP